MKKLLFYLLSILVISNMVHAQGFYARLGLGYAFQHAGQISDAFGQPYSGTIDYANSGTTYNDYSVKKASLSAGFQGAIAGGYMLNKYVGIEMGFTAGLAPKKYTLNETNTDLGSSVIGNSTIVQNAQTPLLLVPSLVMQTSYKKFEVYGRAGLALPLSSKINYQETDVYPQSGTAPNEIEYYDLILKSKFAIGFTGAAGIKYNFNGQLSVFAEATLLSMSLFLKEVDYSEATLNGQNILTSANSSPIMFGPSGSNVNPANLTGTQITEAIPFSNIGINAGVSYNFGSHTSRRDEDVEKRPAHRRF